MRQSSPRPPVSAKPIFEGGIEAWKAAGLPVAVDKGQPLELMRQVQIAAGSRTCSAWRSALSSIRASICFPLLSARGLCSPASPASAAWRGSSPSCRGTARSGRKRGRAEMEFAAADLLALASARACRADARAGRRRIGSILAVPFLVYVPSASLALCRDRHRCGRGRRQRAGRLVFLQRPREDGSSGPARWSSRPRAFSVLRRRAARQDGRGRRSRWRCSALP